MCLYGGGVVVVVVVLVTDEGGGGCVYVYVCGCVRALVRVWDVFMRDARDGAR